MRTGNPTQNFLEDDHRVYTDELENALVDKNIVEQRAHQESLAE